MRSCAQHTQNRITTLKQQQQQQPAHQDRANCCRCCSRRQIKRFCSKFKPQTSNLKPQASSQLPSDLDAGTGTGRLASGKFSQWLTLSHQSARVPSVAPLVRRLRVVGLVSELRPLDGPLRPSVGRRPLARRTEISGGPIHFAATPFGPISASEEILIYHWRWPSKCLDSRVWGASRKSCVAKSRLRAELCCRRPTSAGRLRPQSRVSDQQTALLGRASDRSLLSAVVVAAPLLCA